MTEQNAAIQDVAAESEPGMLGRRRLVTGAVGVAAAAAAINTASPARADATSRGFYKVINPADVAAPYGYSHGVEVGARRTVLLAGEVGQNLDGSWAVGVVAQYERALRNLLAVVRDAGGQPQDLVSLTVFTTVLPQFQASYNQILDVWRRLVGPNYPAMAVIGIAQLWFPESLMEIQGIAALVG